MLCVFCNCYYLHIFFSFLPQLRAVKFYLPSSFHPSAAAGNLPRSSLLPLATSAAAGEEQVNRPNRIWQILFHVERWRRTKENGKERGKKRHNGVSHIFSVSLWWSLSLYGNLKSATHSCCSHSAPAEHPRSIKLCERDTYTIKALCVCVFEWTSANGYQRVTENIIICVCTWEKMCIYSILTVHLLHITVDVSWRAKGQSYNWPALTSTAGCQCRLTKSRVTCSDTLWCNTSWTAWLFSTSLFSGGADSSFGLNWTALHWQVFLSLCKSMRLS